MKHPTHPVIPKLGWSLLGLCGLVLPLDHAGATPCDEPAPPDDHLEVNLGTAIPVPILPRGSSPLDTAPFTAIGFTGHRLAFHDGGRIDLTLSSPSDDGTVINLHSEYLRSSGRVPGNRGGEENVAKDHPRDQETGFNPINALSSSTTIVSENEKNESLLRVPHYEALENRGIYPGITIRHSVNSRQLRTTYELEAGIDPTTIQLRMGGFEAFGTHPATGVLTLNTEATSFAPLSLQARLNDSGNLIAVPVRANEHGVIGFDLGPSASPRTLETVLTYGAYYRSPAAVRGPHGVVALGQTTSPDSGSDAVIVGLDEDGQELRWMTVIAGDRNDQSTSLAVSDAGRIYLAGTTTSTNFPLVVSADQPRTRFVAELAPDGSHLLRGSYLDEFGATLPQDLAIDADGSVLVTGLGTPRPSSTGLDFTTILPTDSNGRTSTYFLARFDADLQAVVDVATFQGGNAGPPLELTVGCGEVQVGYCEIPESALDCSHPYFESPYSISISGVFDDGFVDTVPEGWGYHALRWKSEFKAADYTPMVLPDIPTGLVSGGHEVDLINAEANTALFPVNPGGTGPEWHHMRSGNAAILATGAALSMDLFQTPSYTNLHVDGADVPAAIVEVEFCVDADVANSLRDLCNITFEDLGLGWFQIDVIDRECNLQFGGNYYPNKVWIDHWAGGTFTEGHLLDDLAAIDAAYAVTDPSTDSQIYIIDPPQDAPGAAAFTEELAARFESHIYDRMAVTKTVYVEGVAISSEPALAKVRVNELSTQESP